MLKARASSPRKAKAVTEKSNLGMGREGGREAEVCSARPPSLPHCRETLPAGKGQRPRLLQMCTVSYAGGLGKAESKGGFFLTRDQKSGLRCSRGLEGPHGPSEVVALWFMTLSPHTKPPPRQLQALQPASFLPPLGALEAAVAGPLSQQPIPQGSETPS